MKVAVVQLLDKPCVRTRKVINSFIRKGYDVSYLGVPREEVSSCPNSSSYTTILTGKRIPRGSLKKVYLQFFYFYEVRKLLNNSNFDVVYSVDLDGGIPVYLSKYKGSYLYDVLDTYADRYKLPKVFASFLRFLESKVARSAQLLLHVDETRVPTLNVPPKTPTLILNNVPESSSLKPLTTNTKQKRGYFLISGGVFKHRGLYQILNAHKYYTEQFSEITLKIIGRVEPTICSYIQKFKNVEIIGEVNSEAAQEYAINAYGIFALYEPTSEININACPNKIYDCLFNATPAIINAELNIAKKYEGHPSVFSAMYFDEHAICAAMKKCVKACNSRSNDIMMLAEEYRAKESWERQFEKVCNYL